MLILLPTIQHQSKGLIFLKFSRLLAFNLSILLHQSYHSGVRKVWHGERSWIQRLQGLLWIITPDTTPLLTVFKTNKPWMRPQPINHADFLFWSLHAQTWQLHSREGGWLTSLSRVPALFHCLTVSLGSWPLTACWKTQTKAASCPAWSLLFLCLDDLVAICKEFHGRVFKLEGDKWDLERGIKIRLLEVLIVHVGNVEVGSSRKIKPPCRERTFLSDFSTELKVISF